ncbi:hypothetical protein CARUB_v10002431mg [Capsella rubella]|uniref:Uncharacterized protein n=1 Tax=Capsella rubella TaxID=81985 RepID=R0H4D3_9BRAS|nr:hypothetical protein CARUB_v10002431mg [Capsella rubella]
MEASRCVGKHVSLLLCVDPQDIRIWSKRFVLLFHELSMTGAPISMMELASEIFRYCATIYAVLTRKRIKVVEDKSELSFKTAREADLVIAGSTILPSKQWLTWCEEDHIKLRSQGVLNTPTLTQEMMQKKRQRLRESDRKEFGLTDTACDASEMMKTLGRVTIGTMAYGLPRVEHNVKGVLHPVGKPGNKFLAQNLLFLS